MNPSSPLPEAKCKLEAQDKAGLPVITFYNWNKSLLQLPKKDIQERKIRRATKSILEQHTQMFC